MLFLGGTSMVSTISKFHIHFWNTLSGTCRCFQLFISILVTTLLIAVIQYLVMKSGCVFSALMLLGGASGLFEISSKQIKRKEKESPAIFTCA